MKRLLSVFLALLMILSLSIGVEAKTDSSVTGGAARITIRYVSLGDSIATGTTTPLTAKTNSYTNQFQSYLATANPKATIVRSKFETDGDRTNELLAKLTTNSTMRSAVAAANVITVSIGGNNLMQACKNNSLIGYDFFNPNVSVALQGYSDFMAQWSQIIDAIKTLNPTAQLITMTLYNPYNVQDTYMRTFTDGFMVTNTTRTGMNDLIKGLSTTKNYKVADTYATFNPYSNGSMGTVTLLYPASLLRNPHPNQTGQNLIFGLHKALYVK